MSTAAIGEKVKDAVDHYRDEAVRMRETADAIDEAWKEWDVERLVSLGVINQHDAETIREGKSR
jgi:hypothetical protein